MFLCNAKFFTRIDQYVEMLWERNCTHLQTLANQQLAQLSCFIFVVILS